MPAAGMAAMWLRLPHAWGLSLPLPKDLPARAVCVLRECHLHVGGLMLGADPQDLRERKGGCLGWELGGWPTCSTSSLRGGPDSIFPPPFGLHALTPL